MECSKCHILDVVNNNFIWQNFRNAFSIQHNYNLEIAGWVIAINVRVMLPVKITCQCSVLAEHATDVSWIVSITGLLNNWIVSITGLLVVMAVLIWPHKKKKKKIEQILECKKVAVSDCRLLLRQIIGVSFPIFTGRSVSEDWDQEIKNLNPPYGCRYAIISLSTFKRCKLNKTWLEQLSHRTYSCRTPKGKEAWKRIGPLLHKYYWPTWTGPPLSF